MPAVATPTAGMFASAGERAGSSVVAAAAAGVGGTPAAVGGGGTASPAPATDEDLSRSCCETQTAPGCAQTNVQDCVCARVASCCQSGWDDVCVQLVDALGCASCKGPCCETGVTGGCLDPDVEQCVCNADDTCCNDNWDDYCTVLVDALGCGKCG